MGNDPGIGIQWPLFRFEITPLGITFFPITNSFLFVQPGKPVIGQYLLFFGVLSLCLSYFLIYYRYTKTGKEAGLLTLLGAILILCSSMTEYGLFFSGPAGISVPIGVLLILVLGILMYRCSPQEPEIPLMKKRKIRREYSEGNDWKPEEHTMTSPDTSETPAVTPDYYVSLVVLNFVANYIFLSYYGFVSDDWSTMSLVNVWAEIPVTRLLLEPQRPFTYIIIRTLSLVFGNNQVLFFLTSFILTSILLLVVFHVTHSLLNQIKKCPPSYAFLIAIVYCLLFNKGELYAFGGTMPNTIASILYFASFYYFINSEKKPCYIYISLVCFTFALFTYELGIFFPVLYLLWSVSFKKPVKNAAAFGLPVLFFLIVRLTGWFGYGLVLMNTGRSAVPSLSLNQWFGFFTQNLGSAFNLSWQFFQYGIAGLQDLPVSTMILLIILDIFVALIIHQLLAMHSRNESGISEFNRYPLIFIGFAGMLFSFVLISMNGYLMSRYLCFIDIFACLILVVCGIKYVKKSFVMHGVFILIIVSLIINQGLCFNYVVSHNIQQSVYESVQQNKEEISKYSIIFVDIQSLEVVKGSYRNAAGLQKWSLQSMMQNAGIDASNKTIYYDPDGVTYGSIRTAGIQTFFEFNRTNVNLDAIYAL